MSKLLRHQERYSVQHKNCILCLIACRLKAARTAGSMSFPRARRFGSLRDLPIMISGSSSAQFIPSPQAGPSLERWLADDAPAVAAVPSRKVFASEPSQNLARP